MLTSTSFDMGHNGLHLKTLVQSIPDVSPHDVKIFRSRRHGKTPSLDWAQRTWNGLVKCPLALRTQTTQDTGWNIVSHCLIHSKDSSKYSSKYNVCLGKSHTCARHFWLVVKGCTRVTPWQTWTGHTPGVHMTTPKNTGFGVNDRKSMNDQTRYIGLSVLVSFLCSAPFWVAVGVTWRATAPPRDVQQDHTLCWRSSYCVGQWSCWRVHLCWSVRKEPTGHTHHKGSLFSLQQPDKCGIVFFISLFLLEEKGAKTVCIGCCNRSVNFCAKHHKIYLSLL